ncbi:MAG: acyl-CoA dehydrogenase family protein [Actinomycetota bacterium]
MVDLAAADANVAHLYRGHFAFAEVALGRRPSAVRDRWIGLLVNGALVGNAASESTGVNLADISTTVTREQGVADGAERWVMNGTKFYSTGTLFASHTYVSAAQVLPDGSKERVGLLVATDNPGVECIDDWDGIGQRLTGSGTTVFTNVPVRSDELERGHGIGRGAAHLPVLFQLYLVAVAAGIAAAIVRDTVTYTRQRTRNFITSNHELPRRDPQVLAVVGERSADAFACAALVAEAARSLQRAVDAGNTQELVDEAENATYQAQLRVFELALRSANDLFEVGGASAVQRHKTLDRHWRNLRTLASHNPLILKARQVGDYAVNGTSLSAEWEKLGRIPDNNG